MRNAPEPENDNGKRGEKANLLANVWSGDDRGVKVARMIRHLWMGEKGKQVDVARRAARARPGEWRRRIYAVAQDFEDDSRGDEKPDTAIVKKELIGAINNRTKEET